jgi:hypothetical protein
MLDIYQHTNKYTRPSIPWNYWDIVRSSIPLHNSDSVSHLPRLFYFPDGQREQRQSQTIPYGRVRHRLLTYHSTATHPIARLFEALISKLRLDRITGCYMNKDASTTISSGGTLIVTPIWTPTLTNSRQVTRRTRTAKGHQRQGVKNVTELQVMVVDGDTSTFMFYINIRKLT